MRFTPVAAALSLFVAVSASVVHADSGEPDPRAEVLLDQGKAALAADQPQQAVDAFEAALAIDPGYEGTYLALGEAARAQGLQGKAIRYYREVLTRKPDDYGAISGEGIAMVEKGAVEKARLNLSRLESLCGDDCSETQRLAAAIARGPQQPVLTAEAVMPEAKVSQNN
ncbi:hypothetical protein MKP08_09755 [Erythrobacter sp. LQ02-29]|uniref:tetratricopeptide repeat protein n=1 Tax=unclassified Erythrobacter TaxID=2633097 RepID=UPI001C33ACBA|nr:MULTISPECIES: hypothetical protein [unclassified Erythrobacter]MCP9223031.1 hypothetical protein [Erythrobacter sp. LQ02-29]QWC55778.1 tetratricopeptide repeat protein [Erythrobacter sp. 3-20A1M]